MDPEEWKDWYKEALRGWKEGYKKALEEWREKFRDWMGEARSSISVEGSAIPHMPPMPAMPPIPIFHPAPAGRSNVVASRIGDEELRLIDMLIEAGLFSTRSEAVAYLVAEGVKARKDIFDRVSSALDEIRKIKRKAEEQVEKLRRETGLAEQKEVEIEIEEQERKCPKCSRDLDDLPEDIALCPYCGTNLRKP